ncbi:MAG: LytTR family DNA-binding domain-containing protein [Bacteroidota bacterium]
MAPLKTSFIKPLRPVLPLIGAFVGLNALIGLLFHESLQVVCHSEFLILAVYGFFFWVGASFLIRRLPARWNFWKHPRSVWIHGGLGLFSASANVLLGQGILIFCMVYLYNCSFSPSFDLVAAALTNNVGINFLCYFALAGIISLPRPTSANSPDNTPPPTRIQVHSQGKQFHIPIEEIIFIETDNNCITLHCKAGRFVKYQSLKQFLAETNDRQLIRVHRSFAVNRNWILSVRKNKNGDGAIELKEGSKVKLSRTYTTLV